MKRVSDLISAIPTLLQRKTSSGSFLPQIDGLRFVAIFTVFIVHVIAYLLGMNRYWSSAWLMSHYEHLARGVELFFVISGFVIAMPFLKAEKRGGDQVPLKDYFARRLTRLEPPFLIAMLLTYASLVLVHHASAGALWPHLLATCTYTHAMVYGSKSPIAFITWSLEIEVQFYVVAPLIMTIARLRPWVRHFAFIGLAVASLVCRKLIAACHPVLAASLIEYLPFFIAGIIVCDLAIENGFWGSQRSLRWDAIGALSLLAAYALPATALWEGGALPILFGAVVMSAFRGRLLAVLMSLPWLTAIGGMCYTIYLLHVPLIYFFGHITERAFVGRSLALNAGIQLLVLSPPVLVICSLFFLLIEKPCMNKQWPRNLTRRFSQIGHEDIQVEAASV